MAWTEHYLRGNRVFAETDDNGKLLVDSDGRVNITYNKGDNAKVYRAGAKNLSQQPPKTKGGSAAAKSNSTGKGSAKAKGAAKAKTGQAPHRNPTIEIYTDGACSHNPGPAGAGVVLLHGDERREISHPIGIGTNNIAELTAILLAAEAIDDAFVDEPINLYSDSSYSINILTLGWKAKANKELITETKKALARFSQLRLVKVPGHAGIPENERADELARQGANLVTV